ncbi:hypothetical protein DPEC_G00298260 [Dallia pectoralis]|uniref:Uncharacterized protein n=1 Tax=Dallia pectoralis TaxID=75939 RepID=A0ACC2FFW8_DALPE|nr:hypothetical protein DPEC_G00298260 [Dallia pectoralis]
MSKCFPKHWSKISSEQLCRVKATLAYDKPALPGACSRGTRGKSVLLTTLSGEDTEERPCRRLLSAASA